MIDLKETFDKFDDEYLKFERVQDKLHQHPDICALFLIASCRVQEGTW